MYDIFTIMLSWNRPELSEKTIRSYHDTVSVPYKFMVVDNGSEIATTEMLHSLSDEYGFEVLYLNENRSGLAFNAVLEQYDVSGRYVHFSENDIEYQVGWDQDLVRKLDAFPEVGQISPYSFEMTRAFPAIYEIIKNSVDLWSKDGLSIYITEGNVGTSCLIRRELLDQGIRWETDPYGYPNDMGFSDAIKRRGYKVAWNDRCASKDQVWDINELKRNLDYYVDNASRKGSLTFQNLVQTFYEMGYILEGKDDKYQLVPLKSAETEVVPSQIEKNKQLFDLMYSYFMKTDNPTKKMLYAKWAAHSAWKCHPGFFVHQELEEGLHRVAEQIDCISPIKETVQTIVPRYLHVFSAVYTTGGHTRLADRIIRSRYGKGEIHSILLIDQGDEAVPSWLEASVKEGGGEFTVMEPDSNLMNKATLFREIVYKSADIVFLHTHPDDPIPSVALGIPGGPPVVVINHADHVFWLGSGIADVVANISSSGENVSVSRRAVKKVVRLPIPLHSEMESSPVVTRQNFGISEDAIVMLSVANGYKYIQFEDFDFPKTLTAVLDRCPEAILLVVGMSYISPYWQSFVEKYKGRFIVQGHTEYVDDYYQLADIFIESFPMPSFTATLNAALFGKPVFRAPLTPLSNLFLLDHYDGMNEPPRSIDSYIEDLTAFIQKTSSHAITGKKIQEVVGRTHTGEGWNAIFDHLLSVVPAEHRVDFGEVRFQEGDQRFEEKWAELCIHGSYESQYQIMIDNIHWAENQTW